MMMKKEMKILSVFLAMFLMMGFTTMVCAEEVTGFSIGNGEKANMTNIRNSGASTTANSILGAMQWIGYAVAVGMLVYVGIKYIMASADEKANLKNSLIRYVIGAVLIAGASTIAGWVFKIV